jgi:CheY-like chemotaxis protein
MKLVDGRTYLILDKDNYYPSFRFTYLAVCSANFVPQKLSNKYMNRTGPIIVIEDDNDDQEFFKEAFYNLAYTNKLFFFSDGQSALDFLEASDVNPFLILSDINMPKLNGLELRARLKTDAELEIKCIPYLFFSTASDQKAVINAYSVSAQGFFVKQASMSELEKTITVFKQWILQQKCIQLTILLY